jgi:hypothetical protein
MIVLMKFAEKCPKCGGFVQTKSVRKSIGLGFVEIPVAQFCLNPVCDWYQDFAETKKPEEIKEGFHLNVPSMERRLPEFKKPAITRKHIIALASITGIIVIYFMISFLTPVSSQDDKLPQLQPQRSELSKNNTSVIDTPKILPALPTLDSEPVKTDPKSYIIKMDAGHGFFPDSIIINKSDIIVWNNEENMRTRIVLASKDGLFKNQLLQYPGRFQYQFNQQGNYTFVLAEYPSYKEYQNATGSVIVR